MKIEVFNDCNKDKNRDLIYTILSIFVVGLLIHMSLFTSQVTNPDGVMDGVVKPGHNWEFALGRWGIVCIDALRSNVVLPSLTTIFSIFILSITSAIITTILDIKLRLFRFLSGILFVAFPTFAQMLTYYYCSDSYSISLLISAAAVLLILRWDSWKAVAVASILLMFSLSIYQSFIGVTIACSYLIMILGIVNTMTPMKKIWKNTIKLLLSGAIGLILYFISFRICTIVTGIPPADYRGISGPGNISLSMLPEMFKTAYKGFFAFYFFPQSIYNNQWWGLTPIYGVITALGAILLFVHSIQLCRAKSLTKNEKTTRILLILLLIAIAPLAFYTIVFLTPQTTVAYLMVPQMGLPFICLFSLVEHLDNRYKKVISAFSIAAALILQMKWVVMDNSIYSLMKIEADQIYSQSIRLLDRIESYDDYIPGEQVAIVGYFDIPEYPRAYPELEIALRGTVGTAGQIWCWDPNGATTSWYRYFACYHGTGLYLSNADTVAEIRKTKEFEQMKVFPDKESIGRINGILVVKLSN